MYINSGDYRYPNGTSITKNQFFYPSGAPIDFVSNQQWFWSVEWQEKEHEANEDVCEGRYRDFDDMDDAIDYLCGGE